MYKPDMSYMKTAMRDYWDQRSTSVERHLMGTWLYISVRLIKDPLSYTTTLLGPWGGLT